MAELITAETTAIFYFGGHGRGSGDKTVLATVEGRSPNDGVPSSSCPRPDEGSKRKNHDPQLLPSVSIEIDG